MNSGTPILMISLQIPVLPETDAEDVLQAIAMQVSQALEAIREQQSEQQTEVTEEEPREIVTSETIEPFTDNTKDDLLVSLGYSAVDNE